MNWLEEVCAKLRGSWFVIQQHSEFTIHNS